MKNQLFLTNSLIIFPSNEGNSEICDFLYQTSRILAKKNLVIVINFQQSESLKEIFLDCMNQRKVFKFCKKIENVYFITPILWVPFRRFHKVIEANYWLNIKIIQLIIKFRGIRVKQKIIWHFFTEFGYLQNFFDQNWLSIYDIIDYHTSPDQIENQLLIDQKIYLLKSATLVTSISATLKNVFLSLYKRPIVVVPQGFNLELFQMEKNQDIGPIFPHDKPIIGFIGHINERLNFKLLVTLINNNPQWRFVFVGPKESNRNVSLTKDYTPINKLLALPNVLWLDLQPKEIIPGIIRQFDIGMIPYDTKYEFIRYCYPMKILEYFYERKPVITTEIEELKGITYCRIAKDAADWERSIGELLLQNHTTLKNSNLMKDFAVKNSWQQKIDSIESYLKTYLKIGSSSR